MTMKKKVLALSIMGLLSLTFALSVRHQAAAATSATGPAVFVASLPEIGTIYSRYDCTHGRRFALGIRISEGGQTTNVRFRAGSFRRDRTLQPGDPTSWFSYSDRRVQWLAAASGGENGTVVGWVRVIGYPSSRHDCTVYAPPRATVQIYPRRYYTSRDILRHFIG
jgi:hypothetical protein